MWTPFGNFDEKIVITETSIYNYSVVHPKFAIENLIKNFLRIYEIIGRNSDKDKEEIEKQIHENIRVLTNKKIFKIENGTIEKIHNLEECSFF